MVKPSLEAPTFTKLCAPRIGGELPAMLRAIVIKETQQLSRRRAIGNQQIAFIIARKTPTIQIGRANKREGAIDHHNLGMMKATFKKPDLCAFFHQPVNGMLYDTRRNGNITIGRNHNLYFDTSTQSSLDFAAEMRTKRQIGIDQRNVSLSNFYGLNKCIMNNTWRFIGITINHTNEFMAGRCIFVFF